MSRTRPWPHGGADDVATGGTPAVEAASEWTRGPQTTKVPPSVRPRTTVPGLDDSFDVVPDAEDDCKENRRPFKYVHGAVRKKAARRQLTGFDCPDCRSFYANADLSPKTKQKLLQKCSR